MLLFPSRIYDNTDYSKHELSKANTILYYLSKFMKSIYYNFYFLSLLYLLDDDA